MRTMRILIGLTMCSLLFTRTHAGQYETDEEPLLVFAAASLAGPLDSLASRYMAISGTPVLIAYGASGTLAQQIRIGADVDLFISADTGWVIRLVNDPSSAVSHWIPFLRNGLVMVTSSDLDHRTRAIGPLDGPTVGKIAIADPETSPAGKYSIAFLQGNRVYDKILGKLIIEEDVRGVINAVQLGIADVGLVYTSDAVITGKVRIVERLPDSLFPPIVYGLATMKGGRVKKVSKFVEYLTGAEADSLFAKSGFIVDTARIAR